MRYEKASFNTAWVATKTLEEFKAHESHHGLSEEQLEEAYDLCVKAEKAQEVPKEKATSRKISNKG